MTPKDTVRTVYSTATDGKCPVCGWPQRSCTCSGKQKRDEALPDRILARLRIEKKGRGGKTVTVVYDLPRNETFLKDLSPSATEARVRNRRLGNREHDRTAG